MPYLSSSYNRTVEDINQYGWNYIKKDDETVAMTLSREYSERKGYSIQFYQDLKDALNKTNLSIVFDDDNRSFNIFGIDLKIICLSSTYENYYNDVRYAPLHGVRPIILLPRMSNVTSNTIPMSLESLAIGTMVSNSNTSPPQSNNSNYWINETPVGLTNLDDMNKVKQHIKYTIKLYYNTNFICCNYTSYTGVEIPLFCLIQGTIITNNDKAVYISTNINISNSYVSHKIVIPSQNIDTTQYYDYLPNITNTTALGAAYCFDYIGYPNINILTKLSSTNSIDEDFIMKPLTAFGQYITFDNVFDTNIGRILNITQNNILVKNNIYTINDETYYCPGFLVTPHSTNGSLYILKI